MQILVRIIGVLFVITCAFNLYGLFYIDPELLKSPITVMFRYTFMFLAGLGFALYLRWGVVFYFLGVFVAWITYFLVYDGKGSLVPLWSTIPLPGIIALISYFAWSQMSWSLRNDVAQKHNIDT